MKEEIDLKIEREGNHLAWEYVTLSGKSYRLFIRRNTSLLFLCGYIIIDRDNEWWNCEYDNLDFIFVHGGLTYSNFDGENSIFGFDCGHWADWTTNSRGSGNFYRDMEYVKSECEKLAEQFSQFSKSLKREKLIKNIICDNVSCKIE